MQPVSPILAIILLKLEKFYAEAPALSVASLNREILSEQLGAFGDVNASVRDAITANPQHCYETEYVAKPVADRHLLFSEISPVAAIPSSATHVLVRLLRGTEDQDVNVNYDIGRQAVAAQLPANFYARKRAYLLLQLHGELTCKHDRPSCENCPVSLNCIYFNEHLDPPGSDEKVD